MRRDGTISLWGQFFEVPYELSGRTIQVVIDPHLKEVVALESQEGKPLGQATPLDRLANNSRRRRRPSRVETPEPVVSDPEFNAVEQAYQRYNDQLSLTLTSDKDKDKDKDRDENEA